MDVANVAKCALQIIRHLSTFSDVTRWCQSVATEKAVVCSCSSMVAILSNISIPFITDRNKEMLKTSKLHPAAFAHKAKQTKEDPSRGLLLLECNTVYSISGIP